MARSDSVSPPLTSYLEIAQVPLRQEQTQDTKTCGLRAGREEAMSGDSSADIRTLPRAYVRYKTGS